MPSGSGLLIGVGGSGRQSLTRLAAAILGTAFYQPEITKDFGRIFISNIYTVLVSGRGIVFVFNLTHYFNTAKWNSIPGLKSY